MILAKPLSWFSEDYRIFDNDKEVAVLDNSRWRERATVELESQVFSFYRKGLLRSTFVLENVGGAELAIITSNGTFRSSYTISYDGAECVLKPKSFFKRSFILCNEPHTLGSITTANVFSRQIQADLPEALPLHVQIFILWVVLMNWRRRNHAAGGSSSG